MIQTMTRINPAMLTMQSLCGLKRTWLMGVAMHYQMFQFLVRQPGLQVVQPPLRPLHIPHRQSRSNMDCRYCR